MTVIHPLTNSNINNHQKILYNKQTSVYIPQLLNNEFKKEIEVVSTRVICQQGLHSRMQLDVGVIIR